MLPDVSWRKRCASLGAAMAASGLFLVGACITGGAESPPAGAEGTAPPSPPPVTGGLFMDYQGAPEIIRTGPAGHPVLSGRVFEDLDRDSRHTPGEPGLPGVKVSNGREVVLTDADGAYTLPARDDMSVFVIQPAGFQVPHDSRWIPRFSYTHKPEGSASPLRFGGLAPTGPLPQAINFPLIRTNASRPFRCAVLGDIQAYSNQEIGYFRDSVIRDLVNIPEGRRPDCLLALGDVLGDDLGLIPRLAEVMASVRVPQWWVHGNHDFDFDAATDQDSSDSWRRMYGPNYYAFEIGDAVFINLDNVVFPCGPHDTLRPGREFCQDPDTKRYNGRVSDDQVLFLRNLLAVTPREKLIVISHHIPFVSFADPDSAAHQTDNTAQIHELLAGRPALSLSGHTHSVENLSPGDSFAGWEEAVGVGRLPFRHIIAGAASGSWYQGDFDIFGVPMALQRLGAPRGWLDLYFEATDYTETYQGSNLPTTQRMWLSVNTPGFRDWFSAITQWTEQPETLRDPVPPFSINDLADVRIITPDDLAAGSFLTANVWDGSSETRVVATIGDRQFTMTRTQAADGEAPLVGPDWADPFAAQRQLSVARIALSSRSGSERNQGYESFRGRRYGPSPPRPQGIVADRSVHLWKLRLPDDLKPGVYDVQVRSTDRHGRTVTENLVIEIRPEQPPARFRSDVWNTAPD